ncbi:acetyltransferase [Azoarcus sp. KH32C]|uniref:acetyltransferase n=1 Tax=Azoarcus sp. KH32C TaxID=748247 RepID=UPI00023866B0|nr:acetyltransferase [Azoarcus sp. KH32C]BAL22593.1 putative UDP-perosamine 4-acetyltransferase [Azoarcus sp. KH32C]
MSRGVIVIGAGGHAKVVIELLVAGGHVVDYCVAGPGSPDRCLGIEVLSGDHHLHELFANGWRSVFPAIGANHLRERVAGQAREIGFKLVSAISPFAIVSPSATLGNGIAIMGGAVINAEARIDDLAIINTGATVDHDCHIGTCAHIAPQCALAGNVEVGPRAFLGAGTVVIPGITIGTGSTIGAGSVVVRDIPSSIMALGHPAKPVYKENPSK